MIMGDSAASACDKPGAVCRDQRFIGGDGIMFYFHGKKGMDFCLVSDVKLHINTHFIGKKSKKGGDFTWVESISVLFGPHQLYIGAKKVAKWKDSMDNMTSVEHGSFPK
ncbi:late [Abeliophyllum distichum]|uniref:Late n=1 Tax=Abeliophyllum distichum TaxID=126358 RepID=A0ABD1NXP5_9LAMI